MDIKQLQQELEHSVNLLSFIATLDAKPRTRIGQVALESLAGANGFTFVANEGIGDWFKSVWEAIWKGIKQVYQWVITKFKNAYRDENRRLSIKQTKALKAAVMDAKNHVGQVTRSPFNPTNADKLRAVFKPPQGKVIPFIGIEVIESLAESTKQFHDAVSAFYDNLTVMASRLHEIVDTFKVLVEEPDWTPDEIPSVLSGFYREPLFITKIKKEWTHLPLNAPSLAATDSVYHSGVIPGGKFAAFIIDESIRDFGAGGKMQSCTIKQFNAQLEPSYTFPVDALPVLRLTPSETEDALRALDSIPDITNLHEKLAVSLKEVDAAYKGGVMMVDAIGKSQMVKDPNRDVKVYLDALSQVAKDFLRTSNQITAAADALLATHDKFRTGINNYVNLSHRSWYQ